MFETILIAVGGLICLYASITDWKTTEVPDWLTYGGIGLGFGARTAYSLTQNDSSYIIAGAIGFSILWVVGCILYYSAQWGGGDAKLLMALGALLGWQPNLETFPTQDLTTFLINLLVVGGLYGFLYTIVLALKNKEKTSKQMQKIKQTKTAIKAKLSAHYTALALLSAAFFLEETMKVTAIALAIVTVLSFYLWKLTRAVEDVALITRVTPDKLIEGDWVLETIKDKNKVVCSPKDAGLTLEQITKLIELKNKKKLNTVKIKQGIAFIPAFFFAYLVTFTIGNIFSLLRYAL